VAAILMPQPFKGTLQPQGVNLFLILISTKTKNKLHKRIIFKKNVEIYTENLYGSNILVVLLQGSVA
jgi:hypothetical protein